MKKNTKQITEPSVHQGSHLTVTTYPNGEKELNWDWDALVKDVTDSTNLVNVTENKVKKSRSKKK